MKKLSVLMLLCAPLLLAGCGGKTSSSTSSSSSTTTSEPPKNPYQQLEDALAVKYTSFKLEVKTADGGFNLTDTYTYSLNESQYKIDYEKQQYAEIGLDSQKRVETVKGIEYVDASKVGFSKFSVNDSTYSSIQYDANQGSFAADVKTPATFFGSEGTSSITNMKVNISFSTKLTEVKYTYANGNYTITGVYSAFVA